MVDTTPLVDDIPELSQPLSAAPAGTFTSEYRLLSAPVTTMENYTLKFEYNGREWTGDYLLQEGSNSLQYAVPESNGQFKSFAFEIKRVPSLMTSEQSEYDDLGRLTSVVDASGASVSCEYDILNQLTKMTYSSGETVEFTYDAAGNILTMHDASGWQLYEYDALNRLTAATFSENDVKDYFDRTIEYQYDSADQLTKITYPSGKMVSYTYDSAGRISTVQDSAGTTSYAYDATTGLISSVTRPNGTRTLYTFDSNFLLTQIRHEKTDTSALIEQISYVCDAAGRTTKAVFETPSGVRAEGYTYDEFGQLAKVVYSEDDKMFDFFDRTVTYTYNSVGSRTQMSDDPDGSGWQSAVVTNYVYGAGNRLEKTTDGSGVTQTQYYYDAQGNLVMEVSEGKTVRYFYDARGLMVGYSDGETVVSYEYDMAGRRTAMVVNGERTEYVNDVSSSVYQVLEEYVDGAVTSQYTYGSERLSSARSGSSSYYLTDQLGSVRAVANSAGTTQGYVAYDAFGSLLSDPSNLVSLGGYGYAGENLDAATGQIYLRARYMNPTTGRFTQKDPLGYADSFDTFVYCAGEPVNCVDPSGMITWVDGAVSGALMGGVEGVVEAALRGQTGGDAAKTIGRSVVIGAGVGAATVGFSSYVSAAKMAKAAHAAKIAQEIRKINATENAMKAAARTGVGEIYDSGATYSLKFGKTLPKSSSNAIPTAGTKYTPSYKYQGQGGNIGGLDTTVTGLAANICDESGSVCGLDSSNLISATHNIATSFGNTQIGSYTWGSSLNASLYDSIPTNAMDSFLNSHTYTTGGVFDRLGYYGLGGVCLDKAAELIGTNLSDIQGAVYDPTTGQLIFVGEKNTASTQGVNTDMLFTAIQQAYSSEVPTYVTLDPPATLYSVGEFIPGEAGKSTIANGASAELLLRHTPFHYSKNEGFTLNCYIDGVLATLEIDSYNYKLSDGQDYAALKKGKSNLPNGINISIDGKGSGEGREITYDYTIKITNNTGKSISFDLVYLTSNLQHRGLSVCAENSILGWVMYEADRVMKCLVAGVDTYTGAIYNSGSTQFPSGYKNFLELNFDDSIQNANKSGWKNPNIINYNEIRYWFTPGSITMEEYSENGVTSMLFNEASIILNSESILNGNDNPCAQKFCNFFNSHYDDFAKIDFAVSDPDDPTGKNVINVKIFALLQEALKAVSLAEFFRQNDIPLDTWWLNSYTPRKAYIPEVIQSIYGEKRASGDELVPLGNGFDESIHWTFFTSVSGGVKFKVNNTKIPNQVIQSVVERILSQKPSIEATSWSLGSTNQGNLNAVAVNLAAQRQSSNVSFTTTDITYVTPGDFPLSLTRSYNSGCLQDNGMGKGWNFVTSELQFQRPEYIDELRILKDEEGYSQICDYDYNTHMVEGEVRFVDYTTGEILNFYSSLDIVATFDKDNVLSLVVTGLDSDGAPIFVAGEYSDGSKLEQTFTPEYNENNEIIGGIFDYVLTRPNSTVYVFDTRGMLKYITDSKNYCLQNFYYNDERCLPACSFSISNEEEISSQKLLDMIAYHYDSQGRLVEVCGPENTMITSGSGIVPDISIPSRKITYEYTDDLLTCVENWVLMSDGKTYQNTGTVEYIYDEEGRIVSIKSPSGLTALDTALNIYGQKTEQTDTLGNSIVYTFSTNTNGSKTTTITDIGNANAVPATASGIDALRYVGSMGSSQSSTDGDHRTTSTVSSKGIETLYNYTGDSLYANGITLNLEGYQTVSIERNAQGLPTKVTDPNNPLAQPITIQYNSANLPTRITDAKGIVTTYEYTDFNAVSKVTEAVGTSLARSTTYAYYSDSKLLKSVTNPLGNVVTEYTYDDRGRVLTEKGADGITVSYVYDTLGRTTSVTSCGYTVSYEYNIYDQVVKTTTPLGSSTSTYDSKTHTLASTTDVLGQTARYAYDYQLDSSGNVTGGTGAVTSTRIVSKTGNSSSDRVVSYQYDLHGNLVLLTMPNGDTASYRYDETGAQTGTFEDDRKEAAVLESDAIQKSAMASALPSVMGALGTATELQFTVSEPIVTATLRYWQADASSSTAQTLSLRTGDVTEFSFDLGNLVYTNGQYSLTLTDSQGNETVRTGYFTTNKLSTPTGLTIQKGTSAGQLQVSWNRVTSASSYVLCYRVEGSDSWQMQAATDVSCTLNNIQPGVNYEFALQTVGNGATTANSDLSDIDNFFLENLRFFDIDGDGVVNVSTDINLLIRYYGRLRGENLVNGLLTANSTRNATEIEEIIRDNTYVFDIDQDGIVNVGTDINLILRYFGRLRGDNLIKGLLTANSGRDAAGIASYISELSAVPSQSPVETALAAVLDESEFIACAGMATEELEEYLDIVANENTPAASETDYFQQVTPDGAPFALVGGYYNVSVNYDTTPSNNTLGTFILQVHYDSRVLSFDPSEQDSGWYFTTGTGMIGAPAVYSEGEFDNDADAHSETDKYIYCFWNDSSAQWPGVTLPAPLLNLKFKVNSAITANMSTQIYFVAKETAPNWSFNETSHEISIVTAPQKLKAPTITYLTVSGQEVTTFWYTEPNIVPPNPDPSDPNQEPTYERPEISFSPNLTTMGTQPLAAEMPMPMFSETDALYSFEYKLSSATEWTAMPVSEAYASFTGVPGATYNVRVKSYGSGIYADSDYSSMETITIPTSNSASYNACDYNAIQTFLEFNGNGAKINSEYRATDATTWTGITWVEDNGTLRAFIIDWQSESLTGELDLTGCDKIIYLDVHENQLTGLNVNGCNSLSYLDCGNNLLTSLSVSSNTALIELYCQENQLSSLTVSTNTALEALKCSNNQIVSLDVSQNTALTWLNCKGNQLSALDVTKNTALGILYCSSNQITVLDVSKNTALEELYCYSNLLSTLDVTPNIALTVLCCYRNQIASLDVTKNTHLVTLYCYSNNLTELDVSRNAALVTLGCWNSNLNTVRFSSAAINMVNNYLYYGSAVAWNLKDSAGNLVGTTTEDGNSYYTLSTLPLTATNAVGTQTISFVEVNASVPLSTPTLNQPTATGTTVSCSWSSVTNAAGYSLEYRLEGDSSWTAKSVSGTSTTFEGTAGSTYDVRVKSVGSASYTDSGYSAVETVTLDKLPLSAPTLNQPEATDTTVSCSWSSVANVAGYELSYKLKSASSWTTKSVSGTSTTFAGTTGSTYEVRVMAIGGGSYSNSDYCASQIVTLIHEANKVQQVSSASGITGFIGCPLTLPICYQTLDGSASLTGLGLRIHYDSSVLEYTGFANQLQTGFIDTPQDQLDAGNEDGDSATDRILVIAWQDLENQWPGDASARLLDVQFRVKESAVASPTTIRFTASSQTPGYAFQGNPVSIQLAPAVLDVDGDGKLERATDGLLLNRYLAGMTGSRLTSQALGENAVRTSADEITAFLKGAGQCIFDIDGNGKLDLLTDGLLLNRYLAGYTGTQLVSMAIGNGSVRSTADEISTYIQAHLPGVQAALTMESTTAELPAKTVLETITETPASAQPTASQDLQVQKVYGKSDSRIVRKEETFMVSVLYSTLNGVSELTGLGLRIHYDSSMMEYAGCVNPLQTGSIGVPQDHSDEADSDENATTDRVLTIAWQDLEGSWPAQTQPTKLLDLLFRVKENAPAGNTSSLSFTAGSLTSGYSFASTEIAFAVPGDPLTHVTTTETPLDSHAIASMNLPINEWNTLHIEFWNFLDENQMFEIAYDSARFALDWKNVRKQDCVQLEFGESSTTNGVTTFTVGLAMTENYVPSDVNTLMATLNFTPVHPKNSIASGGSAASLLSVNGAANVTEILSVPYDLNDDGAVEIMDLVRFARSFNKSSRVTASNYQADAWKSDFNSDGIVDIMDLVLFARNFNATSGRANSVRYSPSYVPSLTSVSSQALDETPAARSHLTDFAMQDFFNDDEDDDFLLSGTVKKWRFWF